MPTEITFNQLYIIGAVIGFVLGLVPLILGFKKQNIKLGIIGFVVSIIVGVFLSLLGALPVCIIFVWLILRKPADEAGSAETEAIAEIPADNAVETSENSSENQTTGD
jgi:hypothetical protein